ncbi:acetyl-CoA carboxylase biotin carboxyl carrier protein subunit [Pontimicrobium sp. SW4]|uniref:Acetyl-CoA carboxylase biotin carboxyl carrier protein subunit n=1 Tax=Pontimicrobium sp. SW4 TaxID=3153519 RepID=A0AAU7BPC0_9FLAO
MNKTYTLKSNSGHEFKLNASDISKTDIIRLSKSKYHVLHNNKSIVTETIESDFNTKTYKIKVNNNIYNINISNILDDLIKEMGFKIGISKLVNEIKAPMPGLILEISVKIGQEVKEDDTLLILEAMKMENIITSPRDGIIKNISVTKGNAVDKNELLIEFE